MDHYIVRIYRRGKDNPRLLVGLVEEVGSRGKKAFTTLDDLWEILNPRGGDTSEVRAEWKRASAETEDASDEHARRNTT